jgi:hypothetical protein
LLPVDETLLLVIPALAVCGVVGWWAGGHALLPVIGILLTALVTFGRFRSQGAFSLSLEWPATGGPFENLARGWTLVLAGAFGFVCLFGARQAFFSRSLQALAASLGLAGVMSLLGPVSLTDVGAAVHVELARRNAETMNTLNAFIGQYPREWNRLVERVPRIGDLPLETERQLTAIARAGEVVFPALLALESVVALAIAWSFYHRLSRTRLGPPLARLRVFRFNDQLVWGLVVGLLILFLPFLAPLRLVGRNLLVFFSALYAVRGLGVLAWFMAPGTLGIAATIGFAMLWWPVLNAVAALGFLALGVTAFGLGVGDTWADWRNRVKTTPTSP